MIAYPFVRNVKANIFQVEFFFRDLHAFLLPQKHAALYTGRLFNVCTVANTYVKGSGMASAKQFKQILQGITAINDVFNDLLYTLGHVGKEEANIPKHVGFQ